MITATRRTILLVSVFGIAFGFVEASVVVYLRHLLNTGLNHQPHDQAAQILAAVPGIDFLKPGMAVTILKDAAILKVEMVREATTLIMLVSVALIAGRGRLQKLAYFLLAFGLWDIFYYIFLRLTVGWPKSFLDTDVFFLLPVPWVGPVLVPVVISTALIVVALVVLIKKRKTRVSL